MIEGQGCGQHGEDRILALVFKDQPTGYLVDVGAANGWDNSNSFGLLQRPGWFGVLVEPERDQNTQLAGRYEGRNGVLVLRCGIGLRPRVETLYAGGQVSTFLEDNKRSAEDVHGIEYTTQQVEMRPLTEVCKQYGVPSDFDFLSIDVEGMDYEVWRSLDKALFSPKLVCIEGWGYAMHGYRELARLGANTIYMREDVCPEL